MYVSNFCLLLFTLFKYLQFLTSTKRGYLFTVRYKASPNLAFNRKTNQLRTAVLIAIDSF